MGIDIGAAFLNLRIMYALPHSKTLLSEYRRSKTWVMNYSDLYPAERFVQAGPHAKSMGHQSASLYHNIFF